MSYELYADEKAQIVRVKARGLLDNAIRKEILGEIAIELRSKGYAKALIDLTETAFDSSEPIEGSVALTMHLSDVGMSPAAKLAFVSVGAETQRQTFERISRKIGYQLQYFRTLEEACRWLAET